MNMKGLTLVELLVSIAIVGLIAVVVYLYTLSSHRAFLVGRAKTRSQENAREAMEFMVREIRQAGFRNWSVQPNPFHRLDLAYNDTIRYHADLFMDCTIAPNVTSTGEDITYRFLGDSNLIQRRDWALGADTWETVADNIEQLEFVYLDSNYNVIPNVSLGNQWRSNDSIRVVRVNLRATERGFRIPGGENVTTGITLEVDIPLRNTFYDSR